MIEYKDYMQISLFKSNTWKNLEIDEAAHLIWRK